MATSDEKKAMLCLRRWSDLPTDLLYMVSNLMKSKIDHLRLRAVCSSWRSSLPLHPRKISLPLKLPVPSNNSVSSLFDASTVYCTLDETTYYRLSPPSHSSDSSSSWLFMVSETNSNTFALLHPLLPHKFSSHLEVLPKQLNLLDFRCSEICRSYTLKVFDCNKTITFPHRKVIVLWDFLANCDFAVLVLQHDGSLSYWRLGDDVWTAIDIKDFHFHDVILHQGKCYAVDKSTGLISFDSELQMSVVAPAVRNEIAQYYLVEYGSELYMVWKVLFPDSIFFIDLSKLNKCNGKWCRIRDMGDVVILLGLDASFSVSAKDFQGCRRNQVYLCDESFSSHSGVYNMYELGDYEFSEAKDFGKMFLPGAWLSTAASSKC